MCSLLDQANLRLGNVNLLQSGLKCTSQQSLGNGNGISSTPDNNWTDASIEQPKDNIIGICFNENLGTRLHSPHPPSLLISASTKASSLQITSNNNSTPPSPTNETPAVSIASASSSVRYALQLPTRKFQDVGPFSTYPSLIRSLAPSSQTATSASNCNLGFQIRFPQGNGTHTGLLMWTLWE